MGIAKTKVRETGMVAPQGNEGERSEPERSAGATIPAAAGVPSGPGRTAVDPEITAKAVRRQFSAGYKRRVLKEADPYAAREESPLSGAVRASIRRT